MAPIERLKILMQVQGNEKVYTNMWQVRIPHSKVLTLPRPARRTACILPTLSLRRLTLRGVWAGSAPAPKQQHPVSSTNTAAPPVRSLPGKQQAEARAPRTAQLQAHAACPDGGRAAASGARSHLCLALRWCAASQRRPVLLQGFMHMTQTGGIKEWFKGNGTNCIRIVPNSAVKFATYQELSRCVAAPTP